MIKTDQIEILMATYNGASYLREQIDSILNQSDSGWHLTISDDCSTDDTSAIIDSYVGQKKEKIARYYSGQQFGNARDHFFHLMKQCDAKWMLFCDQDDTWYPDKIAKLKAAMREAERQYGEETPLLVFSDQTPTDAQLHPLASSLMRYQKQYFENFDYRSILFQNVVTGGAMGINQSLAKLGGKCINSSRVIMHDWWLAVVAARFGKIIYLDEPLGTYRQHEENEVGAKKVGSIHYILAKLSSIEEVINTIRQKKLQASVFHQTYAMDLTEEDCRFRHDFEKKHSGLLFYGKHWCLVHGWTRKIGFILLG